MTHPVADPIAQNISDVLELESRELARTTRARLWMERLGARLARPVFPIGLLMFVSGWVVLNTAAPPGLQPFDPPPFPWLIGLLTLTALLTTTVVLIGQARQSALAAQRAHLDLQINLLTEQKVSKLIHLIEELRADLPGVRARYDPHVSQLKKPADPARVASALKERDPGNDSLAPPPNDTT